jgi:hypothetical protein
MIDRVLKAFERWLGEQTPGVHRRSEIVDVARSACEFKAMYFEPNPADWPADTAAQVVGEVMPAKMIGVDAEFAAAVVPAMHIYFDFLVLTGRWKPHNDEPQSRLALGRPDELAARFGDTDRQSMAGRVMQLAFDEGVDLSDPDAVADFMQRYNAMPYEWRQRVTDGPIGGWFDDEPDRAEEPEDEPTDPVRQRIEAGIAAGLAALSPLITARLDRPTSVTVPSAENEWAGLLSTRLVARVLELADWVGDGRAITATGAMRRSDVKWWTQRWGLPFRDADARSMWDVPGIALPWRIGIDCGVIVLTRSKAGRGVPFRDAPLAERVRLGRAMVQRLLDFVLVPQDIAGELLTAVNLLMLPMLRSMCAPPGQDLTGLETVIAAPDRDEPDSFYPRIIAGQITSEIAALHEWGLVAVSAGRATIPVGLRPGVVDTINSPLAPFIVTVKPDAVPIPEPDFDDA